MASSKHYSGDCWGFRPGISREDAVDIIGIWLLGEQPDWDTVPQLKIKGG